ncbi:MAG: CBS domain-containing protein [Halolamina sp.]
MQVQRLAVEPLTTARETPLPVLASTIADERLGELLVTDRGRPVGIVTDRDVAVAVAREDELDEFAELTAEDVMTEDPATIRADAAGTELPERLAETEVRCLPVVDEAGTLTGVVTLDDVVAAVGEELAAVVSAIEAQSPEYAP